MKPGAIKIAFYKGKGDLLDRLIRWWTKSGYSHVEIVVSGGLNMASDCISSSFMDKGVRRKQIFLSDAHWEVLDAPGSAQDVEDWFRQYEGAPYDLMGVSGFLLGPVRDRKRGWFCSEVAAHVMGWIDPWRYTPGVLYTSMVNGEISRKWQDL